MELHPDQQAIMDFVKGRSASSFVVLSPQGTGKSFIIDCITSCIGNVLVACPTAIAALKVKGSTIHSLFGVPTHAPINPDFTQFCIKDQRNSCDWTRGFEKKKKKIKPLSVADWIIIDEAPMTRCDIIDFIDEALKVIRENPDEPFGGARMMFFGDMGQLPPVATGADKVKLLQYGYKPPFDFTQAKVFKDGLPQQFHLSKTFRQTDLEDIALLSRIRSGTQTDLDLLTLNTNVRDEVPEGSVVLTPYRAVVQIMNARKLDELHGELITVSAKKSGTFKLYGKKGPLPDEIPLKEGCRLVIKANTMVIHRKEKMQVVNGDTGSFIRMTKKGKMLIHIDRLRKTLSIPRKIYEDTIPIVVSGGNIEHQSRGAFAQFPIQLGYCMTIHAAQGSTIPKVHLALDERAPFAEGLLYVALSRVPELHNLTLSRELTAKDNLVRADLEHVVPQQHELQECKASTSSQNEHN